MDGDTGKYYLRRYADEGGRICQVNVYIDRRLADTINERRILDAYFSILIVTPETSHEFFMFGACFTDEMSAREFLRKSVPSSAVEYIPPSGAELASLTGNRITGLTWVGSKEAK